MAYSFRAKGTVAHGTGSLTPGAPAGKAVNDLLAIAAVVRNNSETVATPSGWTDTVFAHNGWNHIWLRIADGTATDTPTFDFSATSASVAQMAAWSGGTVTDMSNIVSTFGDKDVTNIDTLYAALTITDPNCLNIAVSTHNKSAASDAATYAALSPFTKIDELYTAGTDIAFWWGYEIQTTPTSYGAVTHTYTGSADTLQATGTIISVRSSLGAMPRRRMGRTPIGLPYVRIY